MSEMTRPDKGLSVQVKLALVSLMGMLVLVGSAGAVTMDFNGISVVLSNLTTVILPAFLDLVIAYLPIAVTLGILGFILAFLDKILGALKF